MIHLSARFTRLVALASVLAVLAVACSQTPAAAPATAPNQAAPAAPAKPAGQLTKFKMILWGPRIPDAAWPFLAEDQGLFKAEGLDLEIIPASGGGGEALKVLLAGDGDIAFVNPEALWFAAAEGAKLKAVYSIIPNNIFQIVSFPEKNIKSMKDLKGKKVGVLNRGSGTYYGLLTLLQLNGMKESDLEVVATGLDSATPMSRDQVDAVATFESYTFDMTKRILPPLNKPTNLNRILVADSLNSDTDVFVTTEDRLAKNKDVLLRFLTAFRKGQQATIQDPKAGAAAAKKLAQGAEDDARNQEMTDWVVKIWQNDNTKQQGMGYQRLDVLQKQVDIYQQAGLIKGSLDIKNIVTNDLVDALNQANVPGGPAR